MARTNKERYEQTLVYLAKNFDLALSVEINKMLAANVEVIGAKLSLKKAGYWKGGTDEQHAAVRALLLCQLAYFNRPNALQDFASDYVLGQTRTNSRNNTVQQLNEKIREYLQMPYRNLDELADASERVCELTGSVDNLARRRTDRNVSSNPVCYHGVVSWLFAAGYVSKRWLAKEGNDMLAHKVNDYLGDGIEVPAHYMDTIPRGWIWNIHRVGDKTTCHWGLSLGAGVSVACNNTDESPFQKLVYLDNGGPGVKGNTQYGKFRMKDIYAVLNGTVKYGHTGASAPTRANIVVKMVNPDRNTSYY